MASREVVKVSSKCSTRIRLHSLREVNCVEYLAIMQACLCGNLDAEQIRVKEALSNLYHSPEQDVDVLDSIGLRAFCVEREDDEPDKFTYRLSLRSTALCLTVLSAEYGECDEMSNRLYTWTLQDVTLLQPQCYLVIQRLHSHLSLDIDADGNW